MKRCKPIDKGKEKMKNVKLSVIGCFARLREVKNIDYSVKTDSRYHHVDDLNLYVGNVFSFGNSKLGNNIAITKLKEIFTCLDCKDCMKDCYAVKASTQYPTVNNYRWLHTYMAINHLDVYESWIREDLNHLPKKIRFVRIHESGDFFNQSYLDMWTRIIKDYPKYKFYFYTKSENILDFSEMLTLSNVNRVKSHLPNGHINFDDENIIVPKCETMGVPVCPYGRNGQTEMVHCGTQCTLCMNSDCVGFVKH